jgi:hypothetical protein
MREVSIATTGQNVRKQHALAAHFRRAKATLTRIADLVQQSHDQSAADLGIEPG